MHLLVFHAYFYWGFKFLKGSLRDAFTKSFGVKGLNTKPATMSDKSKDEDQRCNKPCVQNPILFTHFSTNTYKITSNKSNFM
jgi:hypothetical protein